MEVYEKRLKKFVLIGIILYIFFLVWILYFKFGRFDYLRFVAENFGYLSKKERFLYDLVPFVYDGHSKVTQTIEEIANLLIFAPLGVGLPLLNKKIKIVQHLLICFVLSLLIEVSQFLTAIGGFATDDLIMNTCGYFIGLIFYVLIFKRLDSKINYYVFLIIDIVLFIIFIYGSYTIISGFNDYIQIIKDYA